MRTITALVLTAGLASAAPPDAPPVDPAADAALRKDVADLKADVAAIKARLGVGTTAGGEWDRPPGMKATAPQALAAYDPYRVRDYAEFRKRVCQGIGGKLVVGVPNPFGSSYQTHCVVPSGFGGFEDGVYECWCRQGVPVMNRDNTGDPFEPMPAVSLPASFQSFPAATQPFFAPAYQQPRQQFLAPHLEAPSGGGFCAGGQCGGASQPAGRFWSFRR